MFWVTSDYLTRGLNMIQITVVSLSEALAPTRPRLKEQNEGFGRPYPAPGLVYFPGTSRAPIRLETFSTWWLRHQDSNP